MSEIDKGLQVTKLTRTDYDTLPPNKKEAKDYNRYLEKFHSRKADRIPERLFGDGPNAYLLQDWVIHRGKGAPRVTEAFRKITNWYGKQDEHRLRRKLIRRMDMGGIRYAARIMNRRHSQKRR